MPAFWGAMEDRQICFAWVVWTGALAPLVKGSSRADLSTSGVPSWGANPAPTNRSELRKPEGRYLGQFSHLSVGQTLLASKEDQPEDSRTREASVSEGKQAQVAQNKETISWGSASPAREKGSNRLRSWDLSILPWSGGDI